LQSLECQSQCKFQEKPETCVRLDEKQFPIFKKDKESVINVGKLLQICPNILKIKAIVSSSSEYDINKKEELVLELSRPTSFLP
jgi:hypothetical protein